MMQQISPIRAFWYPEAERFNHQAAQAIARLEDADFHRRSHAINGRCENLYVDQARIPGLEQLLDYALEQAAGILNQDRARLRRGFWLNRMGPGHTTSRHTHAENDELMSGVYYIQAPQHSGDLLFDDPPFQIRVSPQAGQCLLFDPELLHWVEQHKGTGERLSVAFNIGPLEP